MILCTYINPFDQKKNFIFALHFKVHCAMIGLSDTNPVQTVIHSRETLKKSNNWLNVNETIGEI